MNAEYTICWGFYSNVVRETFASKSAAWVRIREIMSKCEPAWEGGPVVYPSHLSVHTKTHETRFIRLMNGPYENGWSVDSFGTTKRTAYRDLIG